MELLDPGVLITGVSFACFRLLNGELQRLIPAPSSALRNPWKWRNIWTSFIHSLLTGSWALLGFYLHPEMAEDLISTHSSFSHCLIAVSIGYFINDFVDMLQNQKLHQSWELLFHHTVAITPDVRIYAAEPSNADDCYRSKMNVILTANPRPPITIADGVKTNIGHYTWPIIRDLVDDVFVVTEEEIKVIAATCTVGNQPYGF
ncbi:TLC domain-containing protein 2-like isoform X2 [Pseudophryne corroboree]|uniref:TLC domain-containing protein 2-like isoform X2 n=1 Tax=Pseudophryne corroboree TaxID=495146 RepID=UPI0030820F85